MDCGPQLLHQRVAAAVVRFDSAGFERPPFPGPIGASIAARPGYPTVIVPWAMVPNAPPTAFPEGFKALPQPFGVSFTGMACSEPTLLKLAYAFEQATKKRVPPASTP